MTDYVVLRLTNGSGWQEVATVGANSGRSAIRKALRDAEKVYGATECVAVPKRSWQPFAVETAGWKFSQQSVADLYLAARRAAAKLRSEYHRLDSEAPRDESWAEGEALDEALRRMDAQLLARLLEIPGAASNTERNPAMRPDGG